MADAVKNPEKFDVNQEEVGQVYAKALLAATEPVGLSDRVVEELQLLASEVIDRQPEFVAALESPRIATEQKVATLERVFAGRVSAELLTFLKVLAGRGRLDAIRAVARAAREQLNQLRGRVAVTVETAAPLDIQQRGQVEAQLTKALGRTLDMTTVVEPKLISGMVVRVGDTVYDGSVANRLDRLRAKTLEKTYIELQRSLARFEQE